MAGLVPAIHVVLQERFQQPRSEAGRDPARLFSSAATWMAGTSPAMTQNVGQHDWNAV
jgi:hypothetical protein